MIQDGTQDSSRPMARRDLLRLRSRGGDRSSSRGAMPPSPVTRDPAGTGRQPHGSIFNVSRSLMGTYFEVRVGSGVPGGVEVATAALDAAEAVEGALTVYDDESETSLVNVRAHREAQAVGDHLAAVLELGLRIGGASGGAYDVAAGALSLAWGFTRGPRRVPDASTLADARARTGAHLVDWDPARRSVRFRVPGVVLNFGSIGKGYGVDRAVDVVRRHWWPTSTLVHGGRSSLYALGSPPDDFGGRWRVALTDPDLPARELGTVHLRDRGMATSGAGYQRFEADGRAFGHILDPRTGSPPIDHPISSVSVLAPTAAEADAWSTAFYLLGVDRAAAILARRPDLGAIFVDRTGPRGATRVVPLNLATADFTPGPGLG